MAWSVKYDPELKLVHSVLTGHVPVVEINKAAVKGITLAKEKNTNRLLIDNSKLEGAYSALDIYEMPKYYVELNADRANKVAILVPTCKDAYEAIRFYETVCKNVGWNVKVFKDRKDAIDWLLGKKVQNKVD